MNILICNFICKLDNDIKYISDDVFDKIKNALFEVEYVEVDEKPKKPKKIKHVHKEKDKKKEEEKPIVKKIVLPDKNEGKVEHLQEELVIVLAVKIIVLAIEGTVFI